MSCCVDKDPRETSFEVFFTCFYDGYMGFFRFIKCENFYKNLMELTGDLFWNCI